MTKRPNMRTMQMQDTIDRLIAERDAMRAAVEAKWVSVKDRMPEQDGHRGHVLVSRTLPYDPQFGDRDVTMGYHTPSGWRDDHGSITECCDGEVTHWMPLPEPAALVVSLDQREHLVKAGGLILSAIWALDVNAGRIPLKGCNADAAEGACLEGKDAETARLVHDALTAPIPPVVDEALEHARGAVSLATPGEWYVWEDFENRTVRLLSRTCGAITPLLPWYPETVADLTAAAHAVNLVREENGIRAFFRAESEKRMIPAPAKCERCGFAADAPTTGKVFDACPVCPDGKMVSILQPEYGGSGGRGIGTGISRTEKHDERQVK